MNYQILGPQPDYDVRVSLGMDRQLLCHLKDGDGVIIVQYTQGNLDDELLDQVVTTLSEEESGREFNISPSVIVHKLSHQDLVMPRSVERGWTYTAFAYRIVDNDVFIYKPSEMRPNRLVTATVSLNLELTYSVQPQMREVTTGLFKKIRQEATGFYRVTLEDAETSKLAGIIYYDIDGYKIPLTKELLEEKSFFVKLDYEPILKSMTKTVTVKKKEDS